MPLKRLLQSLLEQLIFVVGVADRQVCGTDVTTGALTLYTCLQTQSGMLQYKLYFNMTTTILFSISYIPPNWQIVIFTKKNTNI